MNENSKRDRSYGQLECVPLCKTEHANLCGRRHRRAAAQRLCNRDYILDGETGERVGTAYECCVTQGAARTCRKNGARLFRVSKFGRTKKDMLQNTSAI